MNFYKAEEYITLLSKKINNQPMSSEEKMKLLRYSVIISHHYHYLKKSQYLLIIERLLNCKISCQNFKTEFRQLVQQTETECNLLSNNYELLTNIKLDLRSINFTKWISELHLSALEFTDEFTELTHTKDTEQLKEVAGYIYIQIKKY